MQHGCSKIVINSHCRPLLATAAIIFVLFPALALAGEIRIWPSAVAQGKDVRLGDIAELTGFSAGGAGHLSDTVVSASPCPGSNAAVSAADIRTALAESGANLADIQLLGASRCSVTRPATPKPPAKQATNPAKPRYVPRPVHKAETKEVAPICDADATVAVMPKGRNFH